jgi:protein STE50
MATKEDIARIARSIIKLRDDRIAQTEAQLTRLADDYRKLRQELLPVFKQAKEHSEPLPYAPHTNLAGIPSFHQQEVISPPVTIQPEKTSLSRSFSKKLGLGSTPKNHSPTHIPSTIHEGKENSSLDPSAAATAASNQLTASMSGGPLSHSPSIPSPTSPLPYQHPPLAARSYRETFDTNGHSLTPPIDGRHDPPTSAKSSSSAGKPTSSLSQASTLPPSRDQTASAPPPQSTSASSGVDTPSVEIFKSFKVGLEDPCYKVLPAALNKYNIQADWRQYALYIVYGDQERCVGLEEKPLALFKVLDREGKKPMFMLRKLANPVGAVEVGSGPKSAGGTLGGGFGGGFGGMGSSAASVRTLGVGRDLPGGVL